MADNSKIVGYGMFGDPQYVCHSCGNHDTETQCISCFAWTCEYCFDSNNPHDYAVYSGKCPQCYKKAKKPPASKADAARKARLARLARKLA